MIAKWNDGLMIVQKSCQTGLRVEDEHDSGGPVEQGICHKMDKKACNEENGTT